MLSPATLRTPTALVECGLWAKGPAGFDAMQSSPRFPVGRRVIVRLPGVAPLCTHDRWYLGLQSGRVGAASTAFTTYRARIHSFADDTVVLTVDVASDAGAPSAVRQVSVPRAQVVPYNQRSVFAAAPSGDALLFEDGIKCNYSSLLMRAHMAEVRGWGGVHSTARDGRWGTCEHWFLPTPGCAGH